MYNNYKDFNYNNGSYSNNYPTANKYPNYKVYSNYQNNKNYPNYSNDERIFWAPFVVGGLAGTALGYGIANNNQIKGGYCMHPYPMMPGPVYYQQPGMPYMNNNFYY